MAVVAVSRMPGSLGDQLAQSVALRLDYRYVARAELVRLAAELGEPEAWEQSPEVRERSPTFWERLNEERRRYRSVLRHTVLHLAQQDDVVVVGLGAGQLLKGLRHVLRLQVVAPMDIRLERVMERGYDDTAGPLSREQARELIRRRDRSGAGYMRYLFNIDWMDPQNWDLVVNTGRFTLSEATDLVVGVVERGLLNPRDEDRRQLANLSLGSNVETALLNSTLVWVNGLRVTAEDGTVRVEGEVIAEEDREAAEQVVRAVEGVRMVDNDLRIQPPPLTGM